MKLWCLIAASAAFFVGNVCAMDGVPVEGVSHFFTSLYMRFGGESCFAVVVGNITSVEQSIFDVTTDASKCYRDRLGVIVEKYKKYSSAPLFSDLWDSFASSVDWEDLPEVEEINLLWGRLMDIYSIPEPLVLEDSSGSAGAAAGAGGASSEAPKGKGKKKTGGKKGKRRGRK